MVGFRRLVIVLGGMTTDAQRCLRGGVGVGRENLRRLDDLPRRRELARFSSAVASGMVPERKDVVGGRVLAGIRQGVGCAAEVARRTIRGHPGPMSVYGYTVR